VEGVDCVVTIFRLLSPVPMRLEVSLEDQVSLPKPIVPEIILEWALNSPKTTWVTLSSTYVTWIGMVGSPKSASMQIAYDSPMVATG